MIKKLIKAVRKHEKQVNDICSQLDAMQAKALETNKKFLQQSLDNR
jgi:ubiquitin